ncbi:MAG TPA: Asp-tRNA(Asn)/Glu-tRNA(Gln) amidotransferase GatCAB subunit A, partial [Candidatus Latescibacteria bacterium]|nr:Asp-tRNA(Asn)/Glu-tRNA(Gln) amidotransferase GatCAB subunit A [Candidatus Latescibacterota bacterium]
DALQDVGALLVPTTPFPAPTVAETDDETGPYWQINGMCLRNTSAVSLLGLCAISLPCGFTRGGLPIGLQLIAKPWEEARLLRLAQAYESATQWHHRFPDLTALG